MTNSTISRVALKRTVLAAVLGLCLSQIDAFAQSTAGDIVGTAAYIEGAKLQIKNTASGVSRSITLQSNGRFRVSALPAGNYQVDLIEGGQVVASHQVQVVAGQTSNIGLIANSDTKSLDAVIVRAPMVANGIDTSSVESRTTFTAEQLNELPVPRDISSVARLTPGTTQGSGYFGNLNSFGGASVAENSYYVNGMNVTNSYDYLSFSEVPWQAIDQLDVQTGGYGAEYGFSTGGVTSVNIKRGTNEWHGGISIDSSPDWASAHLDDEYYRNGNLFRALSKNKSGENTYTVWESGPLIKDKLFIFALGSLQKKSGSYWGNARASSSVTSSTMYDYDTTTPYKLIKLDWYLNDRNHIEYTGFDNSKRAVYNYHNLTYTDSSVSKSGYTGQLISKSGGPTHIFKWTSNLADDLTMALQYGRMHSRSEEYTVSPDGTTTSYDGNVESAGSGCPRVGYSSSYTGVQNSCYITSTLGVSNGYSNRNDYRIDFDWTLGNHDLKFGYDFNDVKVKAGESYSGGHYYYYYNDSVIDYVYKTGGSVEVKQNSWYIQDKWHLTDNFLLSIGVRNDSFKNYNTSGDVFVKQDNIWQPRVGFSWDITGDGRSRLYGNVGRYALPIAANVALRAASASYYTWTEYTYTGISANGTPTGTAYVDGGVYNGENGTVPNAKSVASKNLDPYTQDEAILGYQYTLTSDNDFLNDWVLGIKATYRKVHNAIDDTCSAEALYNAASAAGYDVSSWSDQWTTPSGIAGCWLFNPGSSSTISTDVDGDGSAETITMSADALGPKAKRTYKAMTLTAEKGTDKWYGNFSYTWSKSQGNYEGLVKSNNGQDDTGTTSDFDFAQIMAGAYGYLANDRRHQIKLYGGYKFTPEWQLGLNVSIQSGAPISCYGGGTGTAGTEYGYSASWHYCNDEISAQGTQGRTPWTYTFSPDLVYKPAAIKGLTAQLKMLNIFNNVKPLQVYQSYEGVSSAGTTTYSYYKLGQYYTDPRSVSLQLMYEW